MCVEMSSDWPGKFAKRNPQYRDTKQALLRNTSSFRVSETVERFSWSSLVATVASVLEPVLIKTRNEAVLEGVRPLNLLFEDNNSEGGTGIVQFSC
ncbi:hypothetical protein NC652_020375 [Populus alba x Populus x berolinensis]|nr:hypothetical protein NC652_020375 [Populus alba x Populus x berolinensis]